MFNILSIIAIPSSCRNNLHPNANFHIRFIVFFLFFLVLDVVALPLIAIEGVHWARDGPKFVCKVDGCNASNTPKYNLVWHL
jgi:hypothetical protein